MKAARLFIVILTFLIISCATKPIDLEIAPGGEGQVQIEVLLQEGYKFAPEEGISTNVSELEGITWESAEAIFRDSPAKVKFTVAPDAKPGSRAGNLEITAQFCKKSGTLCLIRQKEIPINIAINPKGSSKAVSVYSIKVKP